MVKFLVIMAQVAPDKIVNSGTQVSIARNLGPDVIKHLVNLVRIVVGLTVVFCTPLKILTLTIMIAQIQKGGMHFSKWMKFLRIAWMRMKFLRTVWMNMISNRRALKAISNNCAMLMMIQIFQTPFQILLHNLSFICYLVWSFTATFLIQS